MSIYPPLENDAKEYSLMNTQISYQKSGTGIFA
jgi:hypothetical protein